MSIDAISRERLSRARVGHLATADSRGRPHVVPICFALWGEVLFTAVDAKPKSGRPLRRLRNLIENPYASVIVDHYEEDWGRLWWVRVDGQAEAVEQGEQTRAALELLAGKYPQYRDQPPPGPVIRLFVERCTAWPPPAPG